jgi:hypothetical protein
MEQHDQDCRDQREQAVAQRLFLRFLSLGNWRFKNLLTGRTHDLSAANIQCIDVIESDGSFVV